MKTLSFTDLGLQPALEQAIKDLGFEEPTPIQSLAIPVVRDGRDMIGQAHTGTGKTAAYGIPLLERIEAGKPAIQALVLCPTRELAIQVSEELAKLARHLRGITIIPVYGGQPIERQFGALRKGVQVVIATPGRLIDHLDRRTINLNSVSMVVLDEADEMLDMGFREDIEKILHRVPEKRQTVLFSATMSDEILALTRKFLTEPRMIKVVHGHLAVPAIEQRYFEVRESEKVEVLSRLVDFYDPKLVLVFCNTKRKVDELCRQLQARGYLAEGLHGDMEQKERERVMTRFRTGGTDILVATDVAARGIDVEEITLVINYDVPQDPEYYIHRIGRTGRAGKSGKAFTFVTGKEMWKLRDIQKFAKIRIGRHAIPEEKDLKMKRIEHFMNKVREIIKSGESTAYIPQVEQIAGEDYTSLEVAAALLKMTSGDQSRARSGGKKS